MDEIVKRLALRIKLRNLSGSVVHHVALLKRALEHQGYEALMVKGYCVIPETKEACEHYWVRVGELDLDVGFTVARLRNPELMALSPLLLETLPDGLNRSDTEEILIREENSRLFDLYQSDPKAFWREAPRDVATFSDK
jgi:hypothetical protein